MPLAKEDLETYIRRAFPDADITFTDLAGDNDHWSVTVKSAAFKEKSRIQQHKMVYAALEGAMDGTLHALQIKTGVRDEG